MNSINESLHLLLKNAVEAAYPDLTDPPVDVSVATNPKFGDYQCNSALPLCKLLSTKGKQTKLENFLTNKKQKQTNFLQNEKLLRVKLPTK